MGKALTRLGLILLITLTGSGCISSGGDGASNDGSGGHYTYANKVYLDEAMLEQLAPYVSSCQNNKRCVTICHRPPGNPDNCHTKLLPVQAIAAHLNHGSPNHTDHDYVGPCEAGPGEGGDEGGGEVDDGTVGGDEGGDDAGDGEIPPWCVPYLELDSDCDGIIDGTEDPLL